MKKFIFIVLLILMATVFCFSVAADEAYVIKDYDVHITISENNVLNVEERLIIDFSQERHGIYYDRQFRGVKYNIVDGETFETNFWYKITDFDVQNYEFSKSTSQYGNDHYLSVKIGDPDILVYGIQEYVITYKSALDDDGFTQFDEFYQDLITCAYGDTIENASFIIEFPTDIDANGVAVAMGAYGTAVGSAVHLEVTGNVISGYTKSQMTGGDILTLRAQLPEGYFTNVYDPLSFWTVFVFSLMGIFVVIGFLLWVTRGRDRKRYPTIEFYAPDRITSAEAGYIIDGKTDDKDVVSLLIYWAGKGYLNIREVAKNDIDLQKLKNLPDDAKQFEKSLFNALFESGDLVHVKSLKNTFYVKMQLAKAGVTSYYEKSDERRIFTKKSIKARGWMGLLTVAPIAIAMYTLMYTATLDFVWSLFVTIFVSVIISMPVFVVVRLVEQWRSLESKKKVGQIVLSLVFLGALLSAYILVGTFGFDIISLQLGLLITLTSVAATLFLMWMASIMKKRTKQGSEMYARLLGFKYFIENAEKDRIITLVEEDPSYFFDILPYAYVLGVTDKWSKKFEGIAVAPPSWYTGYNNNAFSTGMFVSSISKNMSHIKRVATSQPPSSSSSGGGSFSGGGFSGGGGGGGGAGGSW